MLPVAGSGARNSGDVGANRWVYGVEVDAAQKRSRIGVADPSEAGLAPGTSK